ncbi:NUDIX domain-containing protein [Oryzibacter oryziterrae]|uniref:NUDIX domain-containing protein n=1 Tax=Oryzibacter oryziterrae TaxID=2766474 RepID=UPI001F2A5AFF|nr:NUDIX domain-containing protein [Oryzibacter oryziterrae]
MSRDHVGPRITQKSPPPELKTVTQDLPPSHLPPMTLRDRKVVYDGWLTLEVARFDTTIHGTPAVVVREVHDHGHGAGVLAYDPVRRTAVLVRQRRAAVLLDGGDGLTLEVIAGLVDPGETGETTVRREAWEEAGVTLGQVDFLGKPYSSPGSVTERVWLYLAEIDPTAPRGKGGGMAEEHEELEVLEIPLSQLAELSDAMMLSDLKTLVLVEALRRRRPELF